MLNILFLIFSVDCDSIVSEHYVEIQQMKDVSFCKCVSEKEFSTAMKDFKKIFKYDSECPKIDSLEKNYEKIRKGLR